MTSCGCQYWTDRSETKTTSNPSEHGCAPKKRKNRINDTILSFSESARRDSNPRPSPWQGDTPPLSHLRMVCCFLQARSIIPYGKDSVNIFFEKIENIFCNENRRRCRAKIKLPFRCFVGKNEKAVRGGRIKRHVVWRCGRRKYVPGWRACFAFSGGTGKYGTR